MPEERGMWRALILLGLLLAARPGAAQDLSGTWFGERWTGPLLIQHLSHRGGDGRFAVRFRFFEGCMQVGGQAQEGRWALDGAEFRTWVETVDGAPPGPDGREMAITYLVEGLSEDRVAYLAPNGVLHRAFRVAEDFAMPPPLGCAPVS